MIILVRCRLYPAHLMKGGIPITGHKSNRIMNRALSWLAALLLLWMGHMPVASAQSATPALDQIIEPTLSDDAAPYDSE